MAEDVCPNLEEQVKRGAKLLDEVIVLFRLYHEDYNTIDDSLRHIYEIYKQFPDQPITLGLSRIIEEKFGGFENEAGKSENNGNDSSLAPGD